MILLFSDAMSSSQAVDIVLDNPFNLDLTEVLQSIQDSASQLSEGTIHDKIKQ